MVVHECTYIVCTSDKIAARGPRTYHASPSLILTFPRSGICWCSDATEVNDALSARSTEEGPRLLSSTFLFMAAVADADRSFAMTNLEEDEMYVCSQNSDTNLTRGISFA